MPGTRDGPIPERWFVDHFGFVEGNTTEAKKNFSYGGGILSCEANCKIYQVGEFEQISLGELSARFQEQLNKAGAGFWTAGSLTFKNIVAETRSLINATSNADAVFQVTSLMNCLESIPAGSGPETGVTCYAEAATQGSACAIACPAATIYRAYFLHNPEARKGGEVVDLLSEVGELVGNATNGYWKMRNGFCMPRVKRNIASLSAAIASDAGFEEQVRSRVQVGVHWDTEVYESTHRVCQVFCSAPPVGMMKGGARACDWQVFACTVLDAMYDATLTVAALLAAKRDQRVQCFLTLVGAGSLGCRREWIIDALERALLKHDREPLDVRLVHYSDLPRDMPHLFDLEDGREPGNGAAVGTPKTPEELAAQREKDREKLEGVLTKGTMTRVEALTTTFEAFDQNGDGVIDRREFISMLQKVDALFFTVEVIEKLLVEADANGDGEIHYVEFIQWLCDEDDMILERMGDLVKPAGRPSLCDT